VASFFSGLASDEDVDLDSFRTKGTITGYRGVRARPGGYYEAYCMCRGARILVGKSTILLDVAQLYAKACVRMQGIDHGRYHARLGPSAASRAGVERRCRNNSGSRASR